MGELGGKGYQSYMERLDSLLLLPYPGNVGSIRALFRYLHQEGRIGERSFPELAAMGWEADAEIPFCRWKWTVFGSSLTEDSSQAGIRGQYHAGASLSTGNACLELAPGDAGYQSFPWVCGVCRDEGKERVDSYRGIYSQRLLKMEKYLGEARGEVCESRMRQSFFYELLR